MMVTLGRRQPCPGRLGRLFARQSTEDTIEICPRVRDLWGQRHSRIPFGSRRNRGWRMLITEMVVSVSRRHLSGWVLWTLLCLSKQGRLCHRSYPGDIAEDSPRLGGPLETSISVGLGRAGLCVSYGQSVVVTGCVYTFRMSVGCLSSNPASVFTFARVGVYARRWFVTWAVAAMSLATTGAAASQPEGSIHREYIIETWETEQGLPENSATSMVQTPDGYLWFGTFNGLVRFDGVRFEVFNPSNTPGLPGAGIVNLYLDRSGRLWVSTLDGLAVREGASWRTIGAAIGQSGYVVRSFAERTDGVMLLTTFDGRLLEWSGEEFRTLPAPTGELVQSVCAVDKEGRWWVTHEGYFGVWDGSEWIELGERPAKNAFLGCASARDGGIWLVVNQELRKYSDGVLESVTRIPERVDGIWSVYEDSRGGVWICTHDQGVCRIARDGVFDRWDSSSGLAYDSVRFVFEDRERNIWVGTTGGGLSCFRSRRAQSYGVEHGISERVVNSVWAELDGGLLVGTYGGGLFRLRGESAEPVVLEGIDYGALYIQSVLEDRAGRTWVGTYGLGLIILEGDSVRRIGAHETGGDNIIAMFEDSRGRMWVSGEQGVAVFEMGTPRALNMSNGVALGGVCSFAEDGRGRILATNQRGVFRLEDERFVELSDPLGGSLDGVLCLRSTDNESIWMGTSRKGLLRWRAGRIDRVDADDGFLSVSVQGILEDASGYWWLASERGVVRVSRSQLEAAADGFAPRIEYQLLGREDGLVGASCSSGRQPVCVADSAGQFWFAMDRGVVRLDPDGFVVNGVLPTVEIAAFSYYSASSSHRELGAAYAESRTELTGPFEGVIAVPAGSQTLEFRYTAPSFVSPSEVRFEVILEGFDRWWHDAGTERSMVYHGLKPGRYTFRVRASNDDGFWNETGDSVAVDLAPYIWQTVWFQTAGVFSFAGISAGLAWWLAHAKAALRRRAEADFRTLVEAAPNAMILIDHTGSIVLLNAKAEVEFMWNRAELIGKPIEVLLPDPLFVSHSVLTECLAMHGSPRSSLLEREFIGCRSDGSRFPLEIVPTPIRTMRGTSVLVSIVNVSERKQRDLELARQRSELAHLSRVSVLGELSGAIAHELNQPLTAILSNAQAAQHLMVREPLDAAEVREILADIVEQDKRAGEVIHRLRTLLTKGETTKQLLDMNEVVREVMPLVRSDLIEHAVEIRTELASLPLIRGDRVQLQQVLINLLINGCDAMEDEKFGQRHLILRTGTLDQGVWLSVSDSGPGIAPAMVGREFEPFVTTKRHGMGLGLAVCRTIVESHGGQISAENRPEGGATLKFSIPIAVEGLPVG